jgi:hypothetical protein
MSYRSNLLYMHSGMADSGFATAIALEASTGNLTGGLWSPGTPIVITRVQVLVTVAFNYDTQTAEGRVTFFRRITFGSDTGRETLGIVRLIHGTAAGARIYTDIDPTKILPGQQVVAAITTAGTGGGSIAGDFLPEFRWYPVEENVKNIPTRMVDGSV